MPYDYRSTLSNLQVQAQRNRTADTATNAFSDAQSAREEAGSRGTTAEDITTRLAQRGPSFGSPGPTINDRGTAAGALASRLGQRGPSFGSRSTTGAVRGSVQQRQNYGSMLQQMLEDDQDYNLLDASSRDVYLTASHGLTSQYPAILLTTPRTAKVVDVGSGLTTTPFIIDLNNEVKKTVERDVKAALDQNSAVLQLTTTQYDQNVQIANDYANRCIQASISKDALIKLLRINNISLQQNVNDVSNFIIGDANDTPYIYMSGKENIDAYFKSLVDNYNTSVFTEGSNTQAVTQILKTIFNYFVIGDISFQDLSDDTQQGIAKKSIIDGYLNKLYADEVVNLRSIIPADDSQAIVLLNSNSNVRFSFQAYKNADNITSLTRLIQRDIVAHGNLVQTAETQNYNSSQELISYYTGPFSSIQVSYSAGTVINFDKVNDIFANSYTNINEIIEDSGRPEIQRFRRALIGTEDGVSYGKLDDGRGIDYLIYDEILGGSLPIQFSNLTSTANLYSNYAQEIYNLVVKSITSNLSASQREIVRKIKDYFLSFIRGSGIDTDEISSLGSAFRIGCFIMAANDDKIAARLFRYICTKDKQIHGITNDTEIEVSKNELHDAIAEKIGVSSLTGDKLRFLGSISDGGKRSFNIERSNSLRYMEGDDTSFQTFHNIIRSTEEAYINTYNFENVPNGTTPFGAGLTRDARAFVIFNLFLAVLRETKCSVEISKTTTSSDGVSTSTTSMKIQYYPIQFSSLKFALENSEASPRQLDTSLDQYISTVGDFTTSLGFSGLDTDAVDKLKNDVKYLHSTYFNAIVQKIDQQNQTCLDLSNLLVNHAAQIKAQMNDLKVKLQGVTNLISSNNLLGTEAVINTVQLEQAILKKNIVDRYTNLLRGAPYLPSAVDHDVGQALNTKTVVATYPDLNDPVNDALTRKFLIAVGIPTGLMENLRYQNTISTSEHLYSIDLVFKNLQVTQEEEDIQTFEARVTKGYTFSTRVFVNEGSQLTDGADTKASELTNYSQIYSATKYKVVDDTGNYRDITVTDLERILGDRKIVDNHLMSHYAKLLLKTTAGITLDEEVFDLVPQVRSYPDAAQDANYTTIVDRISVNYPDTPEGQLNKERVFRDLSRSIQLAPDQHKISMMVSKTFERIHVIPVDVSEVIEQLQISREDIAFLDVVAKIRLEDSQPPVTFEAATTRRSYSNALQNALTTFVETDVRSQGIDSVGINRVIETSNRFGGRLGGNNR